MENHFQAIATLISLVNPVVCSILFAPVAMGQSRAATIRLATSAVAIVAIVLLIAAFLGASILKTFGISLDAFSVAGGIVLAFIGFTMVAGPKTNDSGDDAASGSLGKLILFAASPGTITGVITITAQHEGKNIFPAVTAITIVLAATWALMIASTLKAKPDGKSGLAHDMISRYMGLIIIAMGIQFALTGYKAFMGG